MPNDYFPDLGPILAPFIFISKKSELDELYATETLVVIEKITEYLRSKRLSFGLLYACVAIAG